MNGGRGRVVLGLPINGVIEDVLKDFVRGFRVEGRVAIDELVENNTKSPLDNNNNNNNKRDEA